MNDLISRRAAIEALFDWEMTYDWDDHCREEDPKPAYIVSPSDVIEHLSSAQPERKKGKWIERNPQNSSNCRLIECSECGNAYIVGYNIDYDDWIDGRNFCMKCGADLRGGSNGKNS